MDRPPEPDAPAKRRSTDEVVVADGSDEVDASQRPHAPAKRNSTDEVVMVLDSDDVEEFDTDECETGGEDEPRPMEDDGQNGGCTYICIRTHLHTCEQLYIHVHTGIYYIL